MTLPKTEVTLFYLSDGVNPFRYGPYLVKDDVVNAQQTMMSDMHVVEYTFPLEAGGVVRLPSLKDFTETSGIGDAAETKMAYDEFVMHYRATNADFDGWWSANKSRYVVDVDGAVEQLRKMMGQ